MKERVGQRKKDRKNREKGKKERRKHGDTILKGIWEKGKWVGKERNMERKGEKEEEAIVASHLAVVTQ